MTANEKSILKYATERLEAISNGGSTIDFEDIVYIASDEGLLIGAKRREVNKVIRIIADNYSIPQTDRRF